MPEPHPREGCAGKLPRARWQHLMCTKLQRLQPFLALLQMCQLLTEGPQHPAVFRPQEGQPGAPGQLGECPELTPPTISNGRGPSLPIFSPGLFCLKQRAALQSTHLSAFHASTRAQSPAFRDSSASAAMAVAGPSCSPRRALSLLERCKQEGFSYSAYRY